MRRLRILTKLFCLCLSLTLIHGYQFGNASSFSSPSSGFLQDGVGPGLQIDVTAQPSRPKSHGSAERPRIVAFGNSLTAGLGVPPAQSYPAHLQRTLDAAGYAYLVVNAGVSGDTTAGGVRRVSWALTSKPAIVILELGANDGLRGLSLEETADVLHVSVDTVKRDWQVARLWLLRELGRPAPPPSMGPPP